MENVEERLSKIRHELKARFIERDELIDGALIAMLARQHVLMLGPPGTAKSMLARELCERLGGGTYFQWLLTKFTTPEEIFGPISLASLEQGRYERVTDGKLPLAHVAFLDEIFKANSAILNSLLTVLNERQFHQGNQVINVPLQSLIAASNELPEEDELAALYDRFLLRFTVGYIEQEFRFARLLRFDESPSEEVTVLDLAKLGELQRQCAEVDIPDGILRDMIELRRRLNAEGVVASDRRYRQAIDVIRAAALLDGRTEATPHDLRWLGNVLWSDPEERLAVLDAIGKVASGFEDEAQKLLIQAEEILAYVLRPWPDSESRGRAALEAHTKLKNIVKRLEAMREAAEDRGRDHKGLEHLLEKVSDMQRNLLLGES